MARMMDRMMARGVSCGEVIGGPVVARWVLLTYRLQTRQAAAVLPAAGAILVLLFEPAHQRAEIFDDGRRVHLPAAGELGQHFRPRTALAQLEHFAEALAGGGIAVHRALVQRTGVTGGIAQRLVKLE